MADLELASISFSEPELDGVKAHFGNFTDTLHRAVQDDATREFGKLALRQPSTIMLTPMLGIDRPQLIVEAWHETASAGSVGRLQYHSFFAEPILRGEHGMLSVNESEREYPLTTREYMIVSSLLGLTVLKQMLSDNL